MTTLFGCSLVTGTDVVRDAWVRIEDGLIAETGTGLPPATDAVPDPGSSGDAATDLGGALVLPGFVDQHCHGGGQGDFFSLTPGDAARGAAAHLAHGTTSLIASLVTATTEDLIAQIELLAPLVDDGTFAGIHLEGPWISQHQCGAHDVALLRPPALAELSTILDAAQGRVRMVTLAPELPGAIDAVEFLSANGVVVAIGHTDADYATTRAAIDAGATVATHLLNRMPPLDKREPGPVLALVEDPRVVVELIADGVHLHPGVVGHFVRAAGTDRVSVVTDAMGAAAAPDGAYRIGALDVDVRDGVARLTLNGALAGSTLTMDRALRVLVQEAGVPLPAASAVLSATPARAMGLTGRGSLSAGSRADLVVVEPESLDLQRVMRAGRWV